MTKMNTETKKLDSVIIDMAAGPFGSNLKVSCFVNYGFPIIDGANLKGFKVTDNITKYVTEEKARSLHRSIARRNDVVVTISGTLGQIAYIPENSMFEEYLCSQRQFRVTFDTNRVYVPYLVYFFHSREGQHKILAFANQTGVPALSQPLKNFRNIEVNLPDIETQKQVASVLLSIDDKIELNTAINENLEQQAQALFKAWFVDFEPFGEVMPDDWTIDKLGTFIEIKRGGSPRPIQDYLSDCGYRWLKISDVTGLDSPYVLKIKEHIKESGLRKTVLLKRGSLVLSNSATPGIPKILDVDSCIHDGWLYFPQSELTNEYLYLLFKMIRKDLVMLGNGSVFTNLKTDILRQFEVTMPSKPTLDNFQILIKPLFDTMKNIARENQRLAALRDTLLPKLMNGEIDVSAVKI